MADSRNITTQRQTGTTPTQGGGESGIQRTRTWSPFSLMSRMMTDMDRFFDDIGFGRAPWTQGMTRSMTGVDFIPKIDVIERDGKLTLHADLPGMRQEDVKVNVENGVLTISGERTHEHEHEKGGVYRCEREYGSFRRSLSLPEDINPESIQASFDQGVLEVTIPLPEKKEEQKGRTIPIGSKGGEVRH